MTFNELAAAVSAHPDCSVEITDAYIGSTHLFAKSKTEMIRAKLSARINLKNDKESRLAKLWMAEILMEIKAGRISDVRKLILWNEYNR